ncbi:hypothetical protein CCO04_04245 [Pimelobacter sp. 30-1]|nr:hypothetical protein [Pimelobacter sp. 30-1]
MATTEFTTADGRRLRMASLTAEFPHPWDEIVKVSNRVLDGTVPDELQIRDVFIAPRGNADGILEHVLDAEVTQVLQAGGGTIHVAESRRPDLQGIAFWRGDHHEALVWLPAEDEGGYVDPLRGLSGLVFVDHPTGPEVRAAAGEDWLIRPGHLGIHVPGVGSLSLRPAEDALAQIPAWSGRVVDVGELWKVNYDDEESIADSTYFTLATPTLVASLFPEHPDPTGRFTAALSFLAGLGELSLN